MMWMRKYSREALGFIEKTDLGLKKQVLAGIKKVSHNPLPHPQGYGKPLGNKRGKNLTGFFKIKYNGIGIRVVYTLVMEKRIMNILVIDERDDEYCYEKAYQLFLKYGDEIFKDIF